MNLKTKALVTAVAALTLVGSSFAQGAGPQGGTGDAAKAGKQGGRRGGGMRRGVEYDKAVLAKLNLTAKQQSDMKVLKTRIAGTMKTGMERNKGDREAMRTAMQAAGKEYRAGLEKILTAPQQKQYKTLMRAQMTEMRKKFGAGGPGGQGRRGKGAGTPPPVN